MKKRVAKNYEEAKASVSIRNRATANEIASK